MTPTKSLKKKAEQDAMNQAMAEYFARGGQITHIPSNVSKTTPMYGGRAVKGKPNAKQRRGLSAVMGREALIAQDAKAAK